ncbi:hypothetical protein LY76DRAFT_170038 [Colletotrichum caudatum]|nr:hypothetical protein LY76DRAFT_170038 [Colletotrichum caudatum]
MCSVAIHERSVCALDGRANRNREKPCTSHGIVWPWRPDTQRMHDPGGMGADDIWRHKLLCRNTASYAIRSAKLTSHGCINAGPVICDDKSGSVIDIAQSRHDRILIPQETAFLTALVFFCMQQLFHSTIFSGCGSPTLHWQLGIYISVSIQGTFSRLHWHD